MTSIVKGDEQQSNSMNKGDTVMELGDVLNSFFVERGVFSKCSKVRTRIFFVA